MDCNTARLLAEFIRPTSSELEPEQRALVEAHLRTCPYCQPIVSAQCAFDAQIGRAMRAVPIPEGLKTRLRDRLAAQRGAYYRRRILQATAAAAALVLAFWIGRNWTRPPLTTIDPETIAALTESHLKDPKGQVTDWLRAQRLKFQPPLPNDRVFDLNRVAHFSLAHFQGKAVPMLLFIGNHNTFAKVYLIRSYEFTVQPLQNELRRSDFGLLILQDKEQPSLRYVVIYRGDSLEPFLLPDANPGVVARATTASPSPDWIGAEFAPGGEGTVMADVPAVIASHPDAWIR